MGTPPPIIPSPDAISSPTSPLARAKRPHGIDVVLGAQWGDEGKGKLVDLLSQVCVSVCWFVFHVLSSRVLELMNDGLCHSKPGVDAHSEEYHSLALSLYSLFHTNHESCPAFV